MGLRILRDRTDDMAAMYDSVTDWAFGPVFYGPAAADRCQDFIDWLPNDARTYSEADLEHLYSDWCEAETADDTVEADA
jgi:hypothetical protein